MKLFATLCPWLADALGTLEAAALAGRLGHGWLISGPRDIGKRNLAYVLANRLLAGECGHDKPNVARPCDIVDDYATLAGGPDLHPDLHRVAAEADKRSIQVDQIREMTATLALTPHLAGLKVVVIEAADSMTTAAANALLKSLEEPTPDTYLLLLAERPGWLPATVRSRCQKLALKAPDPAAATAWLEEDDMPAADLPTALIGRSPLAAARIVCEPDNKLNYSQIYESINLLYEGKSDPFTMAQAWQKEDAELGLSCLADSLRSRIRRRLVPERWTPVTESEARLTDNSERSISTETLFDGLEAAQRLREQLGRGVNVELALNALLLGLEPSQSGRLST